MNVSDMLNTWYLCKNAKVLLLVTFLAGALSLD